jgi:non-ribosomal peptide synthetase-like protein
VSVNDLYRHPTLGALAARLDALSATRTQRREVAPVPARTALAQALLAAPMLALVGLRWASVAAAVSTVAALAVPWAPSAPWWSLALAWLVLFSPAGRIGIAAGGARLLLRGVRAGRYPRGGSVHVRLWAATRLAELSGATGVASASWTTRYARALGARIGKDVDLHSAPPVTGLLKVGRGAAVEPEVDLGGYWVDGDVVHIGKIRIGAGATVGSRSTLLPGARIGKGARIAAGSTVHGAVPAGQRWAGSPARRTGRSGVRWPAARAHRSRAWALAYGATSVLLGLLPAVAALPALAVLALGVVGAASPGEAAVAALLLVAPATLAHLLAYAALVVAGVRLLGIGMVRGFHPVHSRAGWQVWTTERLMGMARTGLFPLYSSQFTAAWLRLLGARVGRHVEASTVIALPRMTTVADGAFLADDTMVGTYELAGGWMRVAPSRVGEQAFLGNSGMTAPGRSVPDRGLVGVLSAAPRKAKKGSSWLGLPPMPLRRAVERGDTSRTFHPPRRLRVARGLVELCRVVPVMCSAALAVLVVGLLVAVHAAAGPGVAALIAGPLLLAAGIAAAGLATAAKWLLVGRFRPVEHPLWSAFVWRNELADTFVEVLAVPWLVGPASGTPVLTAWLETMGADIGRGAWLETYWLPESDLVRIGDGATVNRGCVVQTHLFHDRIMSMDGVRVEEGATLGPNGIILPGASIGAGTTVGPGSLVTRGDTVPPSTRWRGNPITMWE